MVFSKNEMNARGCGISPDSAQKQLDRIEQGKKHLFERKFD